MFDCKTVIETTQTGGQKTWQKLKYLSFTKPQLFVSTVNCLKYQNSNLSIKHRIRQKIIYYHKSFSCVVLVYCVILFCYNRIEIFWHEIYKCITLWIRYEPWFTPMSWSYLDKLLESIFINLFDFLLSPFPMHLDMALPCLLITSFNFLPRNLFSKTIVKGVSLKIFDPP